MELVIRVVTDVVYIAQVQNATTLVTISTQQVITIIYTLYLCAQLPYTIRDPYGIALRIAYLVDKYDLLHTVVNYNKPCLLTTTTS